MEKIIPMTGESMSIIKLSQPIWTLSYIPVQHNEKVPQYFREYEESVL